MADVLAFAPRVELRADRSTNHRGSHHAESTRTRLPPSPDALAKINSQQHMKIC